MRGNTQRAPWNSGAAWKCRRSQGPGNVTLVIQLKKFLSHYFGTSVESEEAFSSYLLSSFLEDGVGMFEIIITVIRDKERRLLPGSARIAAVRSLEIRSDTDYRAFRERYQDMLYESPVCLPITSQDTLQGGASPDVSALRRTWGDHSESAPTTLSTASPTAM